MGGLKTGSIVVAVLLGCLISAGGVSANTPPVASFARTPVVAGATNAVLLDASASYDPDGSIVAYQWLFGDGFTGSGKTQTHVYEKVGRFEVTLFVIDDHGGTDRFTLPVDLAEPTESVEAPTPSTRYVVTTALPTAPVGTAVGNVAPDFELADLSGTPVRLSEYRGRITVLNFWASRCPACRATMPRLEELRSRYEAAGLVVVGVNLDHAPAVASRYLQENGLERFVTLWGSADAATKVSQTYRVSGIPYTYVIDRQGIIRFAGYGYQLQAPDVEPCL